MRTLRSHSALWLALIAGLASILLILAFLQYRLITEVSQADRERTRIGLDTAAGQFLQDFYSELLSVCLVFRPEPGVAAARDWGRIAEHYQEWTRGARRPALIADLFIWEAEFKGASRLLRLDQKSLQFVPSDWPAGMQVLQARFAADASQERRPNPRVFAWSLDERVPVLVHPLVEFFPDTRRAEAPALRVVGDLAVVLNSDYMRDRLLPELVHRHFGGEGGRAYRVEILDPGSRSEVIYRSDPSLPVLKASEADISIRLINAQPPALRGTPQIVPAGEEGRWQLLAKYRAGSLAAAVAPLRWRNLALSFGVLLLLAAGMALIVVFTRRVDRLARLQMNFVAGVSHELRTPLAVICSAADNLADGTVEAAQPVREYGELIRNEGRRLVGMVEQILRFAADRPGKDFELRPVEVSGAIATALVDSAGLIEKAGTSVEMHIEPGLPPLLADPQGLQQCLLNLLSNAVKYGGESRWLALRAQRSAREGALEIRIIVEDRGLGIEREELREIFQPFYRGSSARSTQARGTGLGLNLTKSIVEAMGGRITVESTPGRGSSFTLHLPAAAE